MVLIGGEATGSVPGSGATARIGGSVTVMASWTGEERVNFLAMLAPFQQRGGVVVSCEGVNDLRSRRDV